MKYSHIFFDLDRTLWDFEKNSNEALLEIYHKFDLYEKGIPNFNRFITNYKIHNEKLWSLYRNNIITKKYLRSSRFQLCLLDFGVDDSKLALDIGNFYIKSSPYKTHLFPYTHEVLSYLKKKYKLHIITNGFQEVQLLKLAKSNLFDYFDKIVTSEQVGVMKPDLSIFNYAMTMATAQPEKSVLIGDDFLVDILGARNAKMDQIYFNPNKDDVSSEMATYEISCLSELKQLL
jgi:putative hydrolase of the HAD superfamily